MLPAADIGSSISTLPVTDGQIDNFLVQFGRTEYEIEITEGVEIAKVGAVGSDYLVIFTPENFGPAKGIFDGLSEQP